MLPYWVEPVGAAPTGLPLKVRRWSVDRALPGM